MRYFIFFFVLLNTACHSSDSRPLRIAAAANLQYAIPSLSAAFSEQTGWDVEYTLASSGKLTAQIVEGAPFDLFLSADLKYPEKLYKAGFANAPPKIYAYGSLVLWTSRKDLELSLDLLFTPQVQHIALANPKIAPYGRAAKEVLDRIDPRGQLSPKFIYGESISQTNHFILSGNADVGFTSQSVVLALSKREQWKWISIDTNWYHPIAQGVVVLKTGLEQEKAAKHFYNFLFSNKAQEILRTFGYRPKED